LFIEEFLPYYILNEKKFQVNKKMSKNIFVCDIIILPFKIMKREILFMPDKFQVIVIGGGATGTGILRDLALRGISCLLLEQNDFATGTSGRFHGLLHSGARYAVKDPHSAEECIRENKILKEIASDCIEDTGGVFISTKNDDPASKIPVKEMSVKELLAEVPCLTSDVNRAYHVPDAAVDGFTLAASNVLSAKAAGASVRTYCEVKGFKIENNILKGVYIRDKHRGTEEFIESEFVINATGPWTGVVSSLAGQHINVSPDKGVLVIFNHRIARYVLNRLRPPGDGDIFVPHGSVTVFGTTSKPADKPDDIEATKEEVLDLIKSGEDFIPGLMDMRFIRAFAGVRPLYQGEGEGAGREATRDFTLIDHEEKGLKGFISVVGGKLTTYRLMAKSTVGLIAKKLGVDKPCITDKEKLVAPFPWKRMAEEEPLCQCERVTKEMLDKAVEGKEHFSLSDVRRLTRLAMGPCQGTFCTFRATGYYHEKKKLDIDKANKLLKDHIQERWKGARPVLWGWQAQETELMRGIYLGLLNLERL
jgi:glycerol-3-phosphate dehydrogenase